MLRSQIIYFSTIYCKFVWNQMANILFRKLYDLQGLRVPPPGNDKIKHRRGRILKFDFHNPDAGVEDVKIVNADEMLDLNPHGISLWEDKKTGQYGCLVLE